jgi:hypothetical protein
LALLPFRRWRDARDTNRLERVGPREFRIRAAFEEGGQSVLRHAVSRDAAMKAKVNPLFGNSSDNPPVRR